MTSFFDIFGLFYTSGLNKIKNSGAFGYPINFKFTENLCK